MNSKTVLPTAIIIAMILCCNNALMAQKRHANVKSVEEFEEVFEKDGTSKKQKVSEITFDQNGNEIEEIEYENGKISEKHVYTYDAQGNKISDIKTKADGKKERFEYKYDENNLRTEKLEYSEKGRLKSKKTYVYKMRQ